MKTRLYGKFGFFNQPKVNVPCNLYMPNGIKERVWHSKNLFVLNNNREDINGGGIAFSEEEAEMSALGEYIERYSSSFQMKEGLFYGSYNTLRTKYNCYTPSDINYFSTAQYDNPNFTLKRLHADTKVHWIQSVNFFNSKNILLPFFMTNLENIREDGLFHMNTTTGTASQKNIDLAIQSGILECIERDGFSKFWYFQHQHKPKKIAADFILRQFPNDDIITNLFNNKKIRLAIYDIGELSLCPTFVVFIFFKKKDNIYQSVGSGSRLTQRDALVRACIEAYQGIEYVRAVSEKNKGSIDYQKVLKRDFSDITSFEKHYALYNLFPELRKYVPILRNAESDGNYSNRWVDDYEHHIKALTKKEMCEKGLHKVYYSILTMPDVKQLGFEVIKVIMPTLNLLTGDFNYPYLGLFKEQKKLFLQFPHPFP